jgi:heme/copper-type cytochrome/quinol oxidase subunit 3
VSHYSIYGTGTIILAISFLVIQCIEYNSLELTMTDSVYGSLFYVLTGFHGMHVTVGIFFLSVQLSVLLDDRETRSG